MVVLTNLRLPASWTTASPDNAAFDISANELDDDLEVIGDLDLGAFDLKATDLAATNFKANDNTASFSIADSTGVLTMSQNFNIAGNSIINTGTLTLPTSTDTLVGRDTTDTLTNKTLTSPVWTTPQLNDTSADHQYVFAVSELAADRTVTWPLLIGNDTLVFQTHIQTLVGKTLTTPTIVATGFTNMQHTHLAANTGGTITEAAISDLQSYLLNIVEDTTPQLGGALDGQGNDLNNLGVIFMTEQAEAESNVGGKGQIWVDLATPNILKFTDDADTDFSVANTAMKLDSFAATTSAELATVLSDETGSGGGFVRATSPTIVTPTIASFASATHDHSNAAGGAQILSTAALSDTANIAYLNTANTYGAGFKQTFDSNGTNAAWRDTGHTADPSATNSGDVYYNTTSNLFKFYNGTSWTNFGADNLGDHIATIPLVIGTQNVSFTNSTDPSSPAATKGLLYGRLENRTINPDSVPVWKDENGLETELTQEDIYKQSYTFPHYTTHIDLNPQDWTKTSGNGTLTTDTTDFYFGSGEQSLKVVTTDDPVTNIDSPSSLAIDFTEKQVYIALKVSDVSLVGSIKFFISSDASTFTNYRQWDLTGGASNLEKTMVDDQWMLIGLNNSWATEVGTPTETGNKMRLGLLRKAGGSDFTIRFGGLISIPRSKKGIITISFDDGFDGIVDNGEPVMSKYGLPALVAFIGANIDDTSGSWMSTADLERLQFKNWQLAPHSGIDTSILSEQDARHTLRFEKDYMQKWGAKNTDTYIPFGGTYTPANFKAISKMFTFGRTARGDTASDFVQESIPAGEPSMVQSYQVSTTSTVATIQTEIQKVKRHKGWLWLIFHNVKSSGATGQDIDKADLDSIVSTISSEVNSFPDEVVYLLPRDVPNFINDEFGNINDTVSGQAFRFSKRYSLPDDTTIGQIQWRALDGAATPVMGSYAQITGSMESDADTSEDGSLTFNVLEAGTNATFLEINQNSSGEIDVRRTTDMNTNNLLNIGQVVLDRGADLTVTANAITITRSSHNVNTGGGAQQVDNATPVIDGQLLVLRASSSSNALTVTDNAGGTGQFRLSGVANDFVSTNGRDTLTCIGFGTTDWLEISRSINGTT